MAIVNASESIPPIETLITTVVGTTAAAPQPVLSTSAVSLPSCLIPTPMVIVSTSSTLIPLGGNAQQPLYMQSASNPFSYGIPPVTIGSLGNFFANNMVPSMPMSSGNTSNNFRPFQFRNAHIPLSNPTLGGAFAAQAGSQVGSIPMSGGGFIPQPYAQYGSSVGIGPGFIPQSINPFGNPSLVSGEKMFGCNPYYSSSQPTQSQPYILGAQIPRNNAYEGGSNPYNFQQNWNSVPPKIQFLATLNLPDLSKLINDLSKHSMAWPPITKKLPLDIPKFEGKVNKDLNMHIMTFHLWCSSNSLMEDNIRLSIF